MTKGDPRLPGGGEAGIDAGKSGGSDLSASTLTHSRFRWQARGRLWAPCGTSVDHNRENSDSRVITEITVGISPD